MAMRWLLLLWTLVWPVAAEVYHWQDAQGRTHYTDQPQAGARVLPLAPTSSYYRVIRVYDGDTIVLEDGRKVRLLGVNTPEVAHFGNSADAGGFEAKAWLVQQILQRPVRLVTDSENSDKYGRTLAHLFTVDNVHINRELIAQGLAELSIYPPNLLFAEELLVAQAQAEQQRLGIWGLLEYAPITIEDLEEQLQSGKALRRQWLRLQGKFKNIRQTSHSIYLEFSPHISARIERRWLTLFPDLQSYVGQRVEMRGRLNKNQHQYMLLLRHPSAIKVL